MAEGPPVGLWLGGRSNGRLEVRSDQYHCCLHSSGLTLDPTDDDAATRLGGRRAESSTSESDSYAKISEAVVYKD